VILSDSSVFARQRGAHYPGNFSEYPYSLVYLEQGDRVWIVAVMHAKRQPDYWKTRIE